MEVPSIQFWSASVKNGTVTHMSTGAQDDVLNLRMACLGDNPQKDSRTVLYCALQSKPKAPICILREGLFENQAIDLKFPGSTKLSFSLGGTNPSPVHLSGFIEPLIDVASFQDEEPGVPMVEVEPPSQEPTEQKIGSKRSASAALEEDESPKKKMKETVVEAAEEKKQEEEDVVVPNSQKSTPGSQKKKKGGKKKKKRKKFTFNGQGVGIRTTKEGKGPGAKKGDAVRVRYIGQLADDTIFDKNLAEGLVVNLGKGDVIKGWEIGLEGLKENEKRKIIVPSELAYGEEGDEKIPANSELWFTLECVELFKN